MASRPSIGRYSILFDTTEYRLLLDTRCQYRPNPNLDLGSVILHTVMHHLSTSTYIPNFTEIKETFLDGRRTPTYCQLRSHVTQKREKIKTLAPVSFRYCALIEDLWSFASPHYKWERRQPLKMIESPTFEGSRP